jgi:hypothetical protein
VNGILEALDHDIVLRLKQEVGRFIVGFVNKVSKICTFRRSANRPIDEMFPSVLPSYFGKLRGHTVAVLGIGGTNVIYKSFRASDIRGVDA